MSENILFSETQRFRQWWIWLILIGLNSISITGIIIQIFLHKPFGDNPTSDMGLIISAVLGVLITVLLLAFRLNTEITENKIHVRFFPFVKYNYEWKDIEKAYVRQYKPIREYGGWGLRGFNNNRALNVSGNMGLQLEMKNGKKLLIGTQKPEEIKLIIEKITSV